MEPAAIINPSTGFMLFSHDFLKNEESTTSLKFSLLDNAKSQFTKMKLQRPEWVGPAIFYFSMLLELLQLYLPRFFANKKGKKRTPLDQNFLYKNGARPTQRGKKKFCVAPYFRENRKADTRSAFQEKSSLNRGF